ncbi:hypothetical protein [Gordonia malaquae]|uniref:hypothetical protein n=1 Tax=Gordonia malaquae TaxID=410332 RepID=UPI0030FEFAA9
MIMVAVGIASTAAVVAGFAGVVVAYGMSSDRPVIIRFRYDVGPTLKKNWMSVIGGSFASAFGGLTGAALFAAALGAIGTWICIAASAVLLHSVGRCLFLFSLLLDVIAAGDERDRSTERTVPVDQAVGVVKRMAG